MTTTSIFRQAKVKQISSINHLINTQDTYNQEQKNNKNYLKENTVIYFENDKLVKANFVRNGKNNYEVEQFNKLKSDLDLQAREDYKQHKLKQKKDNPNKKIRTVLQTKNLTKEFGIFLGGDKDIGSKEDFEQKALNTVAAVLKAKGLSKKNIIMIAIHYDEKTPHVHVQYNDYSFEHKTTATELSKIRKKEGLDKAELRKLNRANFGKFQDLVAENMGMQRGQRDSKNINKSKADYYNEVVKKNNTSIKNAFELIKQTKELEQLKEENKKLKKATDINDSVYFNKNLEDNLQVLFDILGLDKLNKFSVIDRNKEDFEKLILNNIDKNTLKNEDMQKQLQQIIFDLQQKHDKLQIENNLLKDKVKQLTPQIKKDIQITR